MCGIFFWANRTGRVEPALAAHALISMNHRGPDHQAAAFWNGDSFTVMEDIQSLAHSGAGSLPDTAYFAVGHSRLSIIDLSRLGNQPMFGSDNQALSFNGTIYNYIELREKLELDGIRFDSQSDSEVLLRWLCRYGTSRNQELNGSWGFAFVEPTVRRVTLSRDPYGERPLYYYLDNSDLIVASEIKAIFAVLQNQRRSLNPNVLSAFIAYNHWSGVNPTETFYQDIRRVSAGTSLSIDLDSFDVSETVTHSLEMHSDHPTDIREIASDLKRAVSIRLRADVPIGISLSGGVDSSAITAFTRQTGLAGRNISYYTANFSGSVSSDQPYAERLARDLDLPLQVIDIPTNSQALEYYRDLTIRYDQPVPIDGSTMSESLIFGAMARDGMRVVISGTGGDEVFGGYGNEYIEGALHDFVSKGNVSGALKFIRMALNARWTTPGAIAVIFANRLRGTRRDNSPFRNMLDSVKHDYRPTMATVVGHYWGRNAFKSSLADVQKVDCIEGRLSNYVAFADTNAMMHSLEIRSPFLDPTLVKYMQLPVEDKYADGFNKWALRSAMPQDVSPEIIWRRQKQGFTYPFEAFFRTHKTAMLKSIEGCDVLNQLIDTSTVLKTVSGTAVERRITFPLYAVAAFCETHDCVL